MSARWYVTRLDKDAAAEVAFLFQNDDVKEEIERILKRLADQEDPRKPPESSGLIVDELENDAPGWFRLKVPRYGVWLNWPRRQFSFDYPPPGYNCS